MINIIYCVNPWSTLYLETKRMLRDIHGIFAHYLKEAFFPQNYEFQSIICLQINNYTLSYCTYVHTYLHVSDPILISEFLGRIILSILVIKLESYTIGEMKKWVFLKKQILYLQQLKTLSILSFTLKEVVSATTLTRMTYITIRHSQHYLCKYNKHDYTFDNMYSPIS